MAINKAAQDRMKRVFTESFSAHDIAEPLASFDTTSDALAVREIMEERRYEVAGLREKGLIAGYVKQDELREGTCAEYLIPFDNSEVVLDSDFFPTMIPLLADRRRVFVSVLGRVSGIVTRSDLQKPPVRMWLFGMITIIEMGFMRLIEERFPDEGWKQHVSKGRLEKAEELLAERRRRNNELSLLDCLQFSDKGLITLRDDKLREQVGYRSKTRGKETIQAMEALRNNLAHSQDIVACDWDTIVGLAENLDVVLSI